MTEAEWLASTDPAAMLRTFVGIDGDDFNRRRFNMDRKLRLFACACCRQVWDRLTDDVPCGRCSGRGGWVDTGFDCPDCSGTGRINRSRRAVQVAERFADGLASAGELGDAYAMANAAFRQACASPHIPASTFDMELAYKCCGEIRDLVHNSGLPRWFSVSNKHAAFQADLLRHIVGSPWRQTTSIRVGDKVKAKPGNPLACGSGIYDHAIVVSLDPFALVSEQGDMLWTATKTPSDVLLVGHCEMTKAAFDRWQREKQSYPPNGKVLQIPTEWPLTVLDLAQQLYDGRDCAPILHDALLDAGADPDSELVRHFAEPCPHCKDAKFEVGDFGKRMPSQIAKHLRKKCACKGTQLKYDTHPKGCWALDLILGKE